MPSGLAYEQYADEADQYRARAGDNPRTGRGRVVNGRWEGTGRDDIDGLTIDELNSKISQWDQGYRTATHQRFNHGTGQWESDGSGGGSGSGGGAGGGIFGPGGTGSGSLGDRVRAILEQRLSGEGGPWGAEDTQRAKAGAFETLQRRLSSDNRQAIEDSIASGQSGSPGLQANINANRRGTSESYASAARDIDTTARQAQFEAQSQALQTFLEQTRAEAEQAIAREGNSIQRERIAADLRIAERQIQARMDEIGAQMAAEQASGRANRDWQDARDERNRQWDMEDWYRNHPTGPGGIQF